MNITDFIVEYLQQGHSVEIPTVGTLSSIGEHITLRQAFCNDKSIVKLIAEKECVSESIADMMWKNYVDALTDKLKRAGSHEFVGLGVMTYSDGAYGFSSSLKKATIEDTIDAKVIGNVTKYTKSEEEDPFNVFEQPINENVIGTQGMTMTEEEEKVEATPIIATEVEKPQYEHVAPIQESVQDEELESPISGSNLGNPIAKQVSEDSKVEATSTIDTEKDKEQDAIRNFDQCVNPVFEKQKIEDSSRDRMKELDDISAVSNNEPIETSKNNKKKQEKKKKKRVWLWIIILLLLLCLGGGAYYYFCVYNKIENVGVEPDLLSISSEIPVANDFTYNTDLVEFSEEEHLDEVIRVCAFMDEYIGNFLASRGYGYAKDQMMERVEEYTTARIDTLLSTNIYSVRRFIEYDDYIYNTCIPTLKRQKAQGARVEIQIELMELSILDDILHSMIIDLNLKSEFQNVKRVVVKEEPAAPKVTMVKTSKEGFDIIAGFYTSRTSAARMTYVLKNQGCDAYVVEKNNGYYVSMGSAPTRTAAEALLKHIKSWYDGDVVIKKID